MEIQDLRSTPDLLSQNLNFNRNLREFMGIVKTKKWYLRSPGIIGLQKAVFGIMMLEVTENKIFLLDHLALGDRICLFVLFH